MTSFSAALSPGASRVICIAGTDTDAGKSLVTAGLLRALCSLGRPVQGIKAVQTGCEQGPDGLVAPDAALYKEAAPEVPCRALETFKTPCSPHLAARLEGRELLLGGLLAALRVQAEAFSGVTLVEGAGGLFAPFNARERFIDLFSELGAPLILVAPNRLGAINHVLLSLEALKSRKLPVLATVLSAACGPAADAPLADLIAEDNLRIIGELAETPALFSLPFIPGLHSPKTGVRALAWQTLCRLLLPLAQKIQQP